MKTHHQQQQKRQYHRQSGGLQATSNGIKWGGCVCVRERRLAIVCDAVLCGFCSSSYCLHSPAAPYRFYLLTFTLDRRQPHDPQTYYSCKASYVTRAWRRQLL